MVIGLSNTVLSAATVDSTQDSFGLYLDLRSNVIERECK